VKERRRKPHWSPRASAGSDVGRLRSPGECDHLSLSFDRPAQSRVPHTWLRQTANLLIAHGHRARCLMIKYGTGASRFFSDSALSVPIPSRAVSFGSKSGCKGLQVFFCRSSRKKVCHSRREARVRDNPLPRRKLRAERWFRQCRGTVGCGEGDPLCAVFGRSPGTNGLGDSGHSPASR
jgi:hypothetical protein